MRPRGPKSLELGSTGATSSPPEGAPTVVFIAGSGRSGTTLLERVVGAVPGFAAVGELLDLPRRVAPLDEMCGCGNPFSQCAIWQAVGQRAFGGWSEQNLRELHELQARVARQRHLPRLLVSRQGTAFDHDVREYAARYLRIVTAVAQESSARVVVDASKWPALALALHRGGVDVRVLHLVRDVRGVAHSLSRNDIERPHTTGEADVMFSQTPAAGAARWLATQTEMDLVRARGVPVARLSYDSFVRDPAGVLTRALAELDVVLPEGALEHVDGTTVDLGPSHGLSGNPSRFRHGATQLRPDERWRTQMRRRDRLVSVAIAWPQLLRLKAITTTEAPR